MKQGNQKSPTFRIVQHDGLFRTFDRARLVHEWLFLRRSKISCQPARSTFHSCRETTGGFSL
jgi:hypothetical protein